MAETVGRVEFVVDLNGEATPRQAKALGEKIGKTGGDAAGNQFNSSFERKLSALGSDMQSALSKQGRLSGEKFSTSFDSALQGQFRKIQSNLASILSNKDAFADFAKGFDTVDDAVDRINADLDVLTNQWTRYKDETGKVTSSWVLAREEGEKFSAAAADMAEDLRKVNAEQERTARLTEDLESNFARLTRSIGNKDSFRGLAADLGGTNRAFEKLSAELILAGRAAGASRIQIEGYVDRLASTRDAVDGVIAKEAEHRKAQESAAAEAAELERRQNSLGAALSKLGGAWAGLSHNTRQWTLIVSTVGAAMQDLAVLGSAAGAGLLGLGSALTTAVAGAGGFISVLSTLSRDITTLPPELRDSARALDELKGALSGVNEVITTAAVAEMPGAFESLASSTRALYPAFSGLGAAVGTVFSDLAAGLEEGSAGFTELEGLLNNAADDLSPLANATGTWLTALARGFNKANPLADQLIGYIQELGDRFDDFTQSSDFDDWVQRSMTTFSALGELLDATGRMFNDLVTPQATANLQGFLNNLTDFMPHLGNLLDVVGRLDVFGLLAQALAEVGDALEPLVGPMGELADEVNDVASELISGLAVAIGVVADVVAPLAEGLAGILDALPPEAVAVLTASILGLVGAFKALKGIEALAGAANAALVASGSFGGLTAAMGSAEQKAGALRSKLGGLAGKAGIFGAIAVGVGLGIEALFDLQREMANYADNAADAVAASKSFEGSLESISGGLDGFQTGLGDLTNAPSIFQAIGGGLQEFGRSLAGVQDEFGTTKAALDQLVDVQAGPAFSRWAGDMFGVNRESARLALTLNELSKPMADLVNGGQLERAQTQFAGWAEEIGATDEQVLSLLKEMPEFQDALENQIRAQGEAATAANLVEAATGRQATTMGGAAEALMNSLGATEETTAAFAGLGAAADAAGFQIDELSGQINAWSDPTFTARDAAREYKAAIDEMTASVALNGATLDTNTAEGRENEATLDSLAAAALSNAEAIYANTGSQQDANAAVAAGRAELIKQLEQFGITGKAADQYADQLGLIPADVATAIALQNAQDAINKVTTLNGQLDDVAGTYTATVWVQVKGALQAAQDALSPWRAHARGTITSGPEHALIGEAGPEAVVPLRRPLSQVDESVRWLSAIAQGKSMPGGMASGGIVGGGRTNVIEAGAIVIQQARDPLATSVEVLDRLARNLN